MKNITIIVPVYGDLLSLLDCIDSLMAYVDVRHKILLVNDNGPEADVIEREVTVRIKGHPNFIYHRNEKNLGFVKNCNYAVFELDKSSNDILLLNSDTRATEGFLEEMAEVLYLSKRYGAVSPRSNNATIVSVPVRLDEATEYTEEYSRKIFTKVSPLLPRTTEIPVVHGFCMLIRKDIINKYGLFDEIFGRGYGEENDFCLRIGEKGYKVVLANRAYVYHARSKSFTPQTRLDLIKKNREILKKRYPDFEPRMERYVWHDMHSADWFAELLGEVESATKKIAIDLTHLPQVADNKVARIIEFIKYLGKRRKSRAYEFVILTNPDVDQYFNFKQYGLRIVYAWGSSERFHVGYSPYFVDHLNNFISLHRHCLRIAVQHENSQIHPPLPSAKIRHALLQNAELHIASDAYDSEVENDLKRLATKRIDIRLLEKRRASFRRIDRNQNEENIISRFLRGIERFTSR